VFSHQKSLAGGFKINKSTINIRSRFDEEKKKKKKIN